MSGGRICSRLLSVTPLSCKVKSRRSLRKYAALAGSVIAGGCVFVAYEAASLRLALQIRTSAVDVEKLKSYIYIDTESPLPPGNQGLPERVRTGLHRLRRRLYEATLGRLWKPLDDILPGANEDDRRLWQLLQKSRSAQLSERLQAVRELASAHHWPDYQYRNVAQASDARTLVGLARSQDVDLRFFLPPAPLLRSDTGPSPALAEELRALVAALPQRSEDSCLRYFTSLALRDGYEHVEAQRDGPGCFETSEFLYAQTLSSLAPERAEAFCLHALLHHSMVPGHGKLMVDRGALQLLLRLYLARRDPARKVQRRVTRILGNLAACPELHGQIHQSGWLRPLVEMSQSPRVVQACHAARALANLDRETAHGTLIEGMFLLHPLHRSSEEVSADVLFVHGLLGGGFKTWRQQDVETAPSEEGPESEAYTHCWPKAWLAPDCPGIRILSLDYDTHLSDWKVKCPAEQHRRSLASRSVEMLEKLRLAGVGDRPLVWVAHSMGGLLVKKMLSDAERIPEFRQVVEKTRGVVFYSVPHRGSRLAELSRNVGYLLFPSVEVKELGRDSPRLKELHAAFTALVQRRRLRVLSFGETRATPVHGLIRMLVVPLHSSGTCALAHPAGTHTAYIYTHTQPVYIHTQPVYIYTHSLYIYTHTAYIYTHTQPVYIHTHTAYIYTHTQPVYIHTHSLYIYTHTAYIYTHTQPV
ncbi:protein SERAC1 isoform X2 [Lampetra planeri]